MKKFSLILLTTFAHAAFAMDNQEKAAQVWRVDQVAHNPQPLEVYTEQEKINNHISVALASDDKYVVSSGLQQCLKLTTINDKEISLFRRLAYLEKDGATLALLSNNITKIYEAIKSAENKPGKDYYVIPAVDIAVKSNIDLLKKYTAEIESQTSNLTAKSKKAQELEVAKTDLQKQIDELKALITQHRNELAAKEISSKIATTSSEITALSHKLSPLEVKLAEIETDLSKTNSAIHELNQAIAKAKSKTASIETTNQDLETIRKPIYIQHFKSAKEIAIAERDSIIDQISHLKNRLDITGEEKKTIDSQIQALETQLAKKEEIASSYLHYDAKLTGSYGVTDAIPYNVSKAAKKLGSFLTWSNKSNKSNPKTK